MLPVLLDSLMERFSTEHAQFQQSSQVAMETLQRERDELQRQLKQQVLQTTILSLHSLDSPVPPAILCRFRTMHS